jgi:hypothetical protein
VRGGGLLVEEGSMSIYLRYENIKIFTYKSLGMNIYIKANAADRNCWRQLAVPYAKMHRRN